MSGELSSTLPSSLSSSQLILVNTLFKRSAHQVFKQRFCTIIDIIITVVVTENQIFWTSGYNQCSHLQLVRLLADYLGLLQKGSQGFLLLLQDPLVKVFSCSLLRPPPSLLLLVWPPLLKTPGLVLTPTNTSPSLAMFGKTKPSEGVMNCKTHTSNF